MEKNNWFKYALSALVVCASLSVEVWADPPARVGRINYISGSVTFRPGSLDEWGDATINYPLTTGDQIWTDDDSRAEIHIGSTAVRLGQHTDFDFLNLTDTTTQIRLTQGSLNIRVHYLGESDVFEIDTPNSSISLLRAGLYRLDVDPSGDSTRVTVRSGESEVTAEGSAFPVYADQSGVVNGIGIPTYDIESVSPPDSLDDWSGARDRREEQIASLRYISRETIGYEDLDQYGFWRVYPGYGAVWIPTSGIAPGWTPYRYGHWAWVEPWGWTWIDQAPWGFAPFHYGRWAVVDGTWAWIPGQVTARPVYAPALVAFIGGGGFQLSLSFGGGVGVAWFPLGPGEVYVPAYRVSPTYVRNVNITNVNVQNVNITNYTNYNVTNVRYVNQSVPGAVTAVPRNVFAGARPVQTAMIAVPSKAAAAGKVLGMTAPVVPNRESILARTDSSASSSTAHTAVRPPSSALKRQVVARVTPPARPVPFAVREKMLAAGNGRPLDSVALDSLSKGNGAAPPLVRVAPRSPAKSPIDSRAKTNNSPAMKPVRAGVTETHPVGVKGSAVSGSGATESRPVKAKPTEKSDVKRKEKSTAQSTEDKPAVAKTAEKTGPAKAKPEEPAKAKTTDTAESKKKITDPKKTKSNKDVVKPGGQDKPQSQGSPSGP